MRPSFLSFLPTYGGRQRQPYKPTRTYLLDLPPEIHLLIFDQLFSIYDPRFLATYAAVHPQIFTLYLQHKSHYQTLFLGPFLYEALCCTRWQPLLEDASCWELHHFHEPENMGRSKNLWERMMKEVPMTRPGEFRPIFPEDLHPGELDEVAMNHRKICDLFSRVLLDYIRTDRNWESGKEVRDVEAILRCLYDVFACPQNAAIYFSERRNEQALADKMMRKLTGQKLEKKAEVMGTRESDEESLSGSGSEDDDGDSEDDSEGDSDDGDSDVNGDQHGDVSMPAYSSDLEDSSDSDLSNDSELSEDSDSESESDSDSDASSVSSDNLSGSSTGGYDSDDNDIDYTLDRPLYTFKKSAGPLISLRRKRYWSLPQFQSTVQELLLDELAQSLDEYWVNITVRLENNGTDCHFDKDRHEAILDFVVNEIMLRSPGVVHALLAGSEDSCFAALKWIGHWPEDEIPRDMTMEVDSGIFFRVYAQVEMEDVEGVQRKYERMMY